MKVIPFIFLLLLASCGGGDDDGRRLGETIVGIWQRGWEEGDVVIEGNDEIKPENITYDRFEFHDDGTYNGMVRKGTFAAYDTSGELIFEGNYQCDNDNLRLSPTSGEATIVAQVDSFSEQTIILRITLDIDVFIKVTLRKNYSFSTSAS